MVWNRRIWGENEAIFFSKIPKIEIGMFYLADRPRDLINIELIHLSLYFIQNIFNFLRFKKARGYKQIAAI